MPARLINVLFCFEDFTLDTGRRELRRGSELRAVEPQVFDLLEHLVRNRDRVVSRDDLLAAVWNGRSVSEATLASRINAARVAIGDNGDKQQLIRTFLRKGVRFVGTVQERGDAPAIELAGRYPPLPDKPSIAVLPFQNMSGDPEQDYFADGVVEEIITALSRFRDLFVIARNSSFAYKGRAADIKVVSRELGVRYVLEGSVRKTGNRVRVTGQLIDAATGAHLWADRFDGTLEDIFDLQDQVTSRAVGAIAPTLEQAEIERVRRKPTASLDAYDCYLRGIAASSQVTRIATEEALDLFRRAIARDEHFTAPFARAAQLYVLRKANGWMADRAGEIAEAIRMARRAVELGRDDAAALSNGGYALAYVAGDVRAGATFVDAALALNANLANAWGASGWVKACLGDYDTGIQHAAFAMRLSPLDPRLFAWQFSTALAHLLAGRYEEAATWAARSLHHHPGYIAPLRVAAASHALAGQPDMAQAAMKRIRELDPALRASTLDEVLPPSQRAGDRTLYVEGLRKAGLPE
jgi:TolB-like protein